MNIVKTEDQLLKEISRILKGKIAKEIITTINRKEVKIKVQNMISKTQNWRIAVRKCRLFRIQLNLNDSTLK